MVFTGPGADEATDDHEGYVAGRYPDGTYSKIWTDVTECAAGTFLAYAPACECGWRGGQDHPLTPAGHLACQRVWVHDHFQRLAPARQIVARLGRALDHEADFLT
ncbi:hypothetical protein [Pseudonocardia sp. T1-2H]|uniref:hypothetical protein n=1 Tax=Pseudonocardia sp. T1-2H TaxID=3128899 RepID=UPI0031012F29